MARWLRRRSSRPDAHRLAVSPNLGDTQNSPFETSLDVYLATVHDPHDFSIRPLDHLALRGADGDPALILRSGVLTYQDLRSRVAQLAGWLAQQVPLPGARVASWAAKGELTCLMPLAAARAGLVHVPINPLLKRTQVAHILGDSGARLIVGTPARLATLVEGDRPDGMCQHCRRRCADGREG